LRRSCRPFGRHFSLAARTTDNANEGTHTNEVTVQALMMAFGLSRSDYQIGITKVFFRAGR
jgi:hypothetical protein